MENFLFITNIVTAIYAALIPSLVDFVFHLKFRKRYIPVTIFFLTAEIIFSIKDLPNVKHVYNTVYIGFIIGTAISGIEYVWKNFVKINKGSGNS